jgi:hypothetical protein
MVIARLLTLMNNFYTYAYLRKNKTPYYIGKGRKRRAYAPHGKVPIPPKDRILFLKINLSEAEAFKHERYMIAVFGRKDLGTGILLNLTDGGEGHSGFIQTKESKEKRTKKLRGVKRPEYIGKKISIVKTGVPLSEEHKKSISNTLKGHVQSQETKAKRNASLRGKQRSLEARKIMSKRAKERPSKICPHCQTLCLQPVNFNRWHGDNCKNRSK